MNHNLFIPSFAALSHFFFGIYVFRLKPRQSVQTIFFILNLLLSLWMLIQVGRSFLPIPFRNFALNLTFLPISFAPFTLYVLFKKIENKDKGIPVWTSIVNFFGSIFILYTCLSQRMATLKDPVNFIFDLNLNYHFLVAYLSFWMFMAIGTVTRTMLVKRGDFRVRLFIVLLGAALVLPITTAFVYFLPLFGIYKPYLSSAGLIFASILWAVAILHYDAFEIKAQVLNGKDVLFLNRAASFGFLKLLEKLDPMRFIQRSAREKEEITKQILIQDYNLAEKTGELSVEKRARILSKKFGKYFK
ncbi:LIC10906 family membrane protein [Leptospira stimsonii]|uniref:Histidine kinase N-terminal 7TM region domain-containing protein n=1 Tax=Leptospira stimsonii TaxID=2202203 RepID=A0ABY2MU83_9LEPT|nr:histidine kinase N-terminal 7TM domain-containing protein [Leptospira stimsonii]TGK18847.1 hypothetical protein EHO98_12225 [Leptospira stimsonii]TGM07910.1 hypothetical protein EHQ90_23245 [Leptospira stimsonii]